jgi:hypothetical protein
MCITTAPARLSKTKILASKMDNGNHLLSYSNTAKNISGRPNAMILPVPGKLNKELFFDTTLYNNFLKDIEYQIKPKSRGASLKSFKSVLSDDVEDFQVGMYRILLSENLPAIQKVLNELPEAQRPQISQELYDFFASHYAGWSFVVCCFDSSKETDSQPIMFEYKPMYPDYLYYPGMDSHNGLAPEPGSAVRVDHCLMVQELGEDINGRKANNFFKQKEYVPEFLVKHYNGKIVDGINSNGDWYVSIDDLKGRVDNKDTWYKPINFIRTTKHPSLV